MRFASNAACFRTLKIIVMRMMQYMNLMDGSSVEKGNIGFQEFQKIYRVAQKKRPEHSRALCSKLLTDF